MALNYHLLGKKIQQLRVERKIPQIKFAEMINTSSTFVSCMERGIKGPSLETLIMIADAWMFPWTAYYLKAGSVFKMVMYQK